MVLIYGMEYTTVGGHANIWSDKIFDYGSIWRTHAFKIKNYRTLLLNFMISMPQWDEVSEAANSQGALFSVNHPSEGWLNKRPEHFDSMEIWNATFYLPDRFNRYSVNKIWQSYLSNGRSVSAVGGSDKHRFDRTKPHDVEEPTTWIFSREKSTTSILKAIKAGHVAISYTHDAGYLEFSADADRNGTADVIGGDNITVYRTTEIDFSFRYVEPGIPEIKGEAIEISKEKINSLDESINAVDNYAKAMIDPNSKILFLYNNGKKYKAWLLKDNCNVINFTETVETDKKDFYRIELFGKILSFIL